MTSARIFKVCAMVFLASLSVSIAHSQDKVIETQVRHFVQTSGGQAAICGVENVTAIEDHTYRRGGLTVAVTSMSWLADRGNLGVLVQMTGVDFNGSMPPQKSPFKINSAFVAIRGVPIQARQFTCEDQRSFCTGFWIPDSVFAYQALIQEALSIGFNREAGGLDVVVPFRHFPIPFKATDQQSLNAFSKCIGELTESLK